MKVNIGRGFTRMWVVFVGLVELFAILSIFGGVSENLNGGTFHLMSLWLPLLVLVAIPVTAYFLWRVARWIVQGFSD